MGSGKSSAAINYINDHPEDRFIYITPYLEEASRIKRLCPNAGFIEPRSLKAFNGSKIKHTENLISRGKNVATTHQAFIGYSKEMADYISLYGYTLIIDECINVLEPEGTGMMPDDFKMLELFGVLERHGDSYRVTDKEYSGSRYRDILHQIKTRELLIDEMKQDSGRIRYFYWFLSSDILKAFKDVFVLTYMFEGQGLKAFFDLHNMEYQYINVSRPDDRYIFSETDKYIPEYVYSLGDMIDICLNENMNEVGDNTWALSKAWFEKDGNEENITRLKKNIYNYFRSEKYYKNTPSNKKLWGSFKIGKSLLSGEGYSRRFETFNCRATNKWKDSTCLVYAANVFMNVGANHFYETRGAKIYDNDYAVSTMIQWIWRSAIRDGERINIYIPSRRMRGLLEKWIEKVTTGEGC